jgi:hypothetical protein
MLMANPLISGGSWNGWYIRYLTLLVLMLGALQTVAFYTIHYPLMYSSEFAMIVVMWLVIPRVQERRLANTIAGVCGAFVIGVLLQLTVGAATTKSTGILEMLGQNALILVIALALSYLYLRVTIWSDRKKVQLENKRKEKERAKQQQTVSRVQVTPGGRVHRVKKKKHPQRRSGH